jgi:hypothetical protein
MVVVVEQPIVLHQQMEYLVVLAVVVVIILETDLVDLELPEKEILVDLGIGWAARTIQLAAAAVLAVLVEMQDHLMVMQDLVELEYKFLQHLEIHLLLPAIHQTLLLHKEGAV